MLKLDHVGAKPPYAVFVTILSLFVYNGDASVVTLGDLTVVEFIVLLFVALLKTLIEELIFKVFFVADSAADVEFALFVDVRSFFEEVASFVE